MLAPLNLQWICVFSYYERLLMTHPPQRASPTAAPTPSESPLGQ
jgi:hypothetical protein